MAGGLAAWGLFGGPQSGGPGERAAAALSRHGGPHPRPPGTDGGILADGADLPGPHPGGHGGGYPAGGYFSGGGLRLSLGGAAHRPAGAGDPGHAGGLFHPADPAVDGPERCPRGHRRADGAARGVEQPVPGHPGDRPKAAGAGGGLSLLPVEAGAADLSAQPAALFSGRRHHRHGPGLEVGGGRRGAVHPPPGHRHPDLQQQALSGHPGPVCLDGGGGAFVPGAGVAAAAAAGAGQEKGGGA